jgi:hypothetical protein
MRASVIESEIAEPTRGLRFCNSIDSTCPPERNHVQVVRCKGVGCGRNVPTPVEVRVRTGSITVLCPVCLEQRSYIVSTEMFLGSRSWEVMRSQSSAMGCGKVAIVLAQTSARVHFLVRSRKLSESMSQYLIGRVEAHPKIEIHFLAQIVGLSGAEHLENVEWRDNTLGLNVTRPIRHLFVMGGSGSTY